MRPITVEHPRRERLLAIALLWLAAGAVLLLTTLVPAHTALLGWAPLVCLLATPLLLVLVLEPGLPWHLLARRSVRGGRVQRWH